MVAEKYLSWNGPVCPSSTLLLWLLYSQAKSELAAWHAKSLLATSQRNSREKPGVLPGCPSRLSFQAVFYDCHISQVAQNFFTYVAIALNYSVKNIQSDVQHNYNIFNIYEQLQFNSLVVVLTHAHPNKISNGEMGSGLVSTISYRFVSSNLQRSVELMHILKGNSSQKIIKCIHFLYVLPFVRYCSSLDSFISYLKLRACTSHQSQIQAHRT